MSTDKNTKHMEKLYIGPNLPFVLGVGMESIWWSNSENADFADELLHCTVIPTTGLKLEQIFFL